jgi:DUF1365 family protein
VKSGLYTGLVRHKRVVPRVHALRYRVFMLLLDLDEVDALAAEHNNFAHNKRALLSFYDRDHGDQSGAPLRPHLEKLLNEAGVAHERGRILVLSMPRMLGYVFNPLTVYFCYDWAGEIVALIYEVKNTFGERHDYVLPAAPVETAIQQSCAKRFFVSPFLKMGLNYDFEVSPPGESVRIAMRVRDGDQLMLTASFAGLRDDITDKTLARAFWRHPLMTFGAMAAIHWEAIKMLTKGLRYLGRKGGGAPLPHAARSVTPVTAQTVSNAQTPPVVGHIDRRAEEPALD